MVFILAKNYHFTEEYIFDQLPFARALRYYHAAIWSEGAWTVKPPSEDKRMAAGELLQKLQQKHYGESSSEDEF